ncbi:MAG: SH3 domain-containing protein [Eubacteriales bacterium]|nr:SH3 domain-containing protein [Eubacteriales bacterium]
MKGKKILVLIVLFALLMPTLAMAATVKTQYADGSLVVRSGPGTNYEPASWVKNGQSITVLDEGNVWSKIKVDSNGKVGYIKSKYILASGTSIPEFSRTPYELGTVSTKYADSKVNLRTGPGTGYGIHTSLANGTRLFIKETMGAWYHVATMNGSTGWISGAYVSIGMSAETTGNVNLRTGPNTGYSAIRVLPEGTKCTAVEVDGNWTKVKAGKTTGWVHSNYILY